MSEYIYRLSHTLTCYFSISTIILGGGRQQVGILKYNYSKRCVEEEDVYLSQVKGMMTPFITFNALGRLHRLEILVVGGLFVIMVMFLHNLQTLTSLKINSRVFSLNMCKWSVVLEQHRRFWEILKCLLKIFGLGYPRVQSLRLQWICMGLENLKVKLYFIIQSRILFLNV